MGEIWEKKMLAASDPSVYFCSLVDYCWSDIAKKVQLLFANVVEVVECCSGNDCSHLDLLLYIHGKYKAEHMKGEMCCPSLYLKQRASDLLNCS